MIFWCTLFEMIMVAIQSYPEGSQIVYLLPDLQLVYINEVPVSSAELRIS